MNQVINDMRKRVCEANQSLTKHGLVKFTWGKNPENAVYHSVVLEEVSKMNRFTEQINPRVEPAPQHILEKHYQRKHGPNAYYGQK